VNRLTVINQTQLQQWYTGDKQ